MRKLIYVPTVHSVGERHPVIKELFESGNLGGLGVDFQTVNAHTEKIWSVIERGSEALPRDLTGVRIFAEGVTEGNITNLEFLGEQILAAPAETQVHFERVLTNPTEEEKSLLRQNGLEGRQLRLVIRLMLRGAEVKVTEGNYYYEELRLVNEAMRFFKENPDSYGPPGELSNRADANDFNRDRDIANGINTSLIDGETGILLLGAEHGALELLDKDIQIKFIDPELTEVIAEFNKEFEKEDLEHRGNSSSESKG